jgi:hypothetical protein
MKFKKNWKHHKMSQELGSQNPITPY